jgi:NTE family protein
MQTHLISVLFVQCISFRNTIDEIYEQAAGGACAGRRIGARLGHVGVIRSLEKDWIKPDLVRGTSIGSLVVVAYAAGELEKFEKWLNGLNFRDVLSCMDVRFNGGVIKGERLMEFFRGNFIDRSIEELGLPFAAVATSLHTGAEVWLREGSTIDAVRASIAIPAFITPVLHQDRVLVDGALVNPVPVSLARAMGADIVIAVDLNSDVLGHRLQTEPEPEVPASEVSDWWQKLQENLSAWIPGNGDNKYNDKPRIPSMLDVVANSINIMQVRISRSRMAGDPPNVIVAPRLGRLGLLDFHAAGRRSKRGERAAETALPSIKVLFD